MPQGTSATGRLYRLLKEAIAFPTNTPTTDGWAKLLGVEQGNQIAILQAVGRFFELVADSRREIERHTELDPELFLQSIIEIEGVLIGSFPASYTNQWGNAISNLNAARMTALKFSANHFDSFNEEMELPQNDLDPIRQSVEKVLEEILASDLDSDMKHELARRLQDLRQAIIDYRIGGVAPIRQTAEAALGSVIVNVNVNPTARSEGAVSAIKNCLQAAVAAVQLSATAYGHAPQIAAAASVAKTVLALIAGSPQ